MGLEAVILAGGKGSRLRKQSAYVPKAMHSLAGRPMLGHLIQALEEAHATKIYITCSHLASVIGKYVNLEYPECRLVPTSEKAQTPVDALLELEGLVKHDFVLVHGDHYFSANPFRGLFQRHHRGEITFLVDKLTDSQTSGYNNFRLRDVTSNKIVYRTNRKSSADPALETVRIVDGCYVLPQEIFGMVRNSRLEASKKLEKKGKRTNRRKHRRDGMRDLFHYVAAHELTPMRAVLFQGWWQNVNDPETAAQTYRRILDERK